MRVKRISWAGTRTHEYSAMVAFLEAVLGLTASQEESDFAAFQLPEGGTFEVFGPGDEDHAHFSTGPVVGFVVDDLTAAVRMAAKSTPSSSAHRSSGAAIGRPKSGSCQVPTEPGYRTQVREGIGNAA